MGAPATPCPRRSMLGSGALEAKQLMTSASGAGGGLLCYPAISCRCCRLAAGWRCAIVLTFGIADRSNAATHQCPRQHSSCSDDVMMKSRACLKFEEENPPAKAGHGDHPWRPSLSSRTRALWLVLGRAHAPAGPVPMRSEDRPVGRVRSPSQPTTTRCLP